MSENRPSFTRGVFAGAVHDELLFPFPNSSRNEIPKRRQSFIASSVRSIRMERAASSIRLASTKKKVSVKK